MAVVPKTIVFPMDMADEIQGRLGPREPFAEWVRRACANELGREAPVMRVGRPSGGTSKADELVDGIVEKLRAIPLVFKDGEWCNPRINYRNPTAMLEILRDENGEYVFSAAERTFISFPRQQGMIHRRFEELHGKLIKQAEAVGFFKPESYKNTYGR